MKCVCGYEHEVDWEDGKLVPTKGDEEFIYISGHGLYIPGSLYESDKKIELYACPKCQTLRMKT